MHSELAKICFAVNPRRPKTREACDEFLYVTNARGIPATVYDGSDESALAGATVLVVIGGDGTFIHHARTACRFGLPVLGVNLGRVGFLTEIGAEDFPEALGRLIAGDYTTQTRAMLALSVAGAAPIDCLNDVLLYKPAFSGVAHMRLTVGQEEVGSVYGDGIVIATQTGATGYALSAGGPILTEGLDAMVITPICAHTLRLRPIVTGLDTVVRLSVEGSGVVAADGEQVGEIVTGQELTVTRSQKTVSLIRLGERNLFTRIQEKLW
ncbi:MAG: NAD(+)/NADH kinase [Clostridiales bacterium]|nr:NAD(+)/NADH kinase [Clostridiales bacterium]